MWIKLKRNDNYSINENGQIRHDESGRIKRSTLSKNNGYLYVDLYRDNKRNKETVHRLVAEAFIPNPENKPTVDHKDGNRQNNAITNLRWASYSEQNSRFNTAGVRSQRVRATRYREIRKKRGGGHIAWGEALEIKYFEQIGDCARYFGTTLGNINSRYKAGTIGLRGKTRAWLVEYVD